MTTILHRKDTNQVIPDALSRCIDTLYLDTENFMDNLEYNSLRYDVVVYPEKFPKLYVNGSIIYCKN